VDEATGPDVPKRGEWDSWPRPPPEIRSAVRIVAGEFEIRDSHFNRLEMSIRSLFADAFLPPVTGEHEYWFETRRPIYNLVFLIPFLVIYEAGIWLMSGSGDESIRNGADAWMRIVLHKFGIDFLWILPLSVISLLLAWQYISRQPWQIRWDTLGGMLAESLLFAFVLILLGQMTNFCFDQIASLTLDVTTVSWHESLSLKLIAFMGAGIYEEFLFRLCLIPVTYAALRFLMVPHRMSVGTTIVVTSLFFSLAHYLGPSADGQSLSLLTDAVARVQSSRSLLFSFVFRTLAGAFFAGLFFLRGFGVTVGTHAVYDVFVGIVLVTDV